MNGPTWIIPTNEEVSASIAPSSSSTQSMISGSWGKLRCLVEVSVTKQILREFPNSQKSCGNRECANSVYQTLFSMAMHVGLGTRLMCLSAMYSSHGYDMRVALLCRELSIVWQLLRGSKYSSCLKKYSNTYLQHRSICYHNRPSTVKGSELKVAPPFCKFLYI